MDRSCVLFLVVLTLQARADKDSSATTTFKGKSSPVEIGKLNAYQADVAYHSALTQSANQTRLKQEEANEAGKRRKPSLDIQRKSSNNTAPRLVRRKRTFSFPCVVCGTPVQFKFSIVKAPIGCGGHGCNPQPGPEPSCDPCSRPKPVYHPPPPVYRPQPQPTCDPCNSPHQGGSYSFSSAQSSASSFSSSWGGKK